MTGLEKIIEHIRQDADIAAKAIITEGETEAAALLEEEKAELIRLQQTNDEKRKAEVELLVNRGQSAAKLLRRKMLLEAKQQIISDVIEDAKSTLHHLPESDYFALILKMVKKNALQKSGEILFSEKDQKRLPAEFGDTLKPFALTVSKETRNIDGGFVLLYGDIEENCSFDALILTARESLQDKVRDLLFG